MDKAASTVILIAVTALLVFTAIQPVLPTTSQPFSELAVLGPHETTSGYPTNVTIGQSFTLNGYVGNHEGKVSYYQVLVKLGNQTTLLSSSNPAKAPIIFTESLILDTNQSVTFPMQLSLNQSGTNLKLIFELWSFNLAQSQFTYTGISDQLLLNSTAT
jgi:uncharacterized membrane protein